MWKEQTWRSPPSVGGGPLGAKGHHEAPSQAHRAAEPFWQPRAPQGAGHSRGCRGGRAHMHSAVPSMGMWGITLLWSLHNCLSVFQLPWNLFHANQPSTASSNRHCQGTGCPKKAEAGGSRDAVLPECFSYALLSPWAYRAAPGVTGQQLLQEDLSSLGRADG